MSFPQCLQCVAEHKQAKTHQNGSAEGVNNTDLPEIRDAVTLAPSWQQQQIPCPMGPQMAMACVPLPTCSEHLTVGEQSLAQRAAASNLVLGSG